MAFLKPIPKTCKRDRSLLMNTFKAMTEAYVQSELFKPDHVHDILEITKLISRK